MREFVARRVTAENRATRFDIIVRSIETENPDLFEAAVSGATLVCIHPRPPVSSVLMESVT
jgi:hypothetical protein